MTAVYPDLVLVEFYNGAAWVDISAYVVGDIHGTRGLGGWQPTKRVAMLGTLIVVLNNKAKLFSPMGGDAARGLNTLTGFTRGAKIRVRILYRGSYYTSWTGRILTIDSDDKNWGPEHARVYATDWMDVPANFPMKRADIALDKTMDEAIALILARLSIQPEATDIDVGTFEFPAVFDGVKNRTMAIGELNKLALSELGYIYVKGDGTLRAENYEARPAWRPLDTVAIDPATLGYLLKEDGGYLLKEDGGKIVLDQMSAAAVALASDAESYNILMERDALFNSATVRAHPTITDTSLKVLFNMGRAMLFGVDEVKQFSGHYTDPNGLLQVAGTNMQAPVATTDYTANTAEDGSGTDKTADMIVTATYYGDTVEYEITNDSGVAVYLTMLKARGYGIYYGQSIEYILDDAVSQAAYGFSGFIFDMPYQRDTLAGERLAFKIVDGYKDPESRISKLAYLANLNSNHMASFLGLDIGALIKVTEDRSALSNHYYITDVGFTVKQGGVINVTYGLKQNDTLQSGGLTAISVESVSVTGGFVNFGIIPRLSNLTQMSISFWLYSFSAATSVGEILTRYFFSPPSAGGYFIYHSVQTLQYARYYTGSSSGWKSSTGAIPANAWIHIVITHNAPDVPIFYFDAATVSVVDISPAGGPTAPSGTPRDDARSVLRIAADYNYTNQINGKLFDVRYYDRILSAAEVTTLYNAGTPDVSLVTDDLIFQAFAVRTARQGDYIDQVLTAQTTVRDNIFDEVGVPNGTVTGRAAP